MTEAEADTVLRRMTARARAAAAEAVTPTRALRLALTRAAERSVGLTLTVLGVADEVLSLDDLIARIDPSALIVALPGRGDAVGIAVLDAETLAAVTEMQMRGGLTAARAEPRPLTGADAALGEPLITAFLDDIAATAAGTAIDGFGAGHVAAGRIADARAAGMALADVPYRAVGFTLDFAVGDRQGQMTIALPQASAGRADVGAGDWGTAFAQGVMAAPAALHAVLHRLRLPLRAVEALVPGQVLALPGVRVSSVRIEGPDGRTALRGRLGQVSGMRAVRIEAEVAPELAPGPAVLPRPPGIAAE